MRKIAIEEHLQQASQGKIRAKWATETNRPDMMDMGSMKGIVQPRMTSPVEELRLPEMDANGIDMQILSNGAPSAQALSNPDEAISMAREANDFLYEVCKKYPDRFRALAVLPLASPEASAKELDRCVNELGFVGAMVQGHQYFEYLDNEKFYPVWEAAEALDVPLSLHVIDTVPQGMRIYDGCYELLGPIWSWNIECATHVLRTIINGVFDRFPKAQFIAGHLGEGLPFYLGRIDEGYDAGKAHLTGKTQKHPSEYFKSNILVSTSGKYHPAALRCAIDEMGADRIMFATDYPHIMLDEAIEIFEGCNLSEEEKELIYPKNAERIFRI